MISRVRARISAGAALARSERVTSVARSSATPALGGSRVSQAPAAPFGPVAIFDADAPPALAFVRSLGRAGVPVAIHGTHAWPVARFSRHATSFRIAPDPAEPDLFIPWLAREIVEGRIGIVAPTSDAVAYALAEVRDLFPTPVQRAIPTRTATHDALFKELFEQACARFRVATPWSLRAESVEEVLDRARELPYPVVLKPKSHVGVGIARGAVVRDERELRRALVPFSAPPGARGIFARHRGLEVPLVQEYVPRAIENLFSVSGLLDEGRAIAWAGSRKIGQWPKALGVGLEFESWHDEEPLAVGVELAERLLGRGIFELELIRDPRDGRYLAIDLNPRAFGQIALDMARDRDLPLLWYRVAIGEAPAPLGAATKDARWMHSIPYGIERALALVRGSRVRTSSPPSVPRVDVVHDPDDPLPTLRFAAAMLRHPGGLVRPFLRK